MPTYEESRDVNRVWHCSERKSTKCYGDHYTCRGTGCKDYKPNKGSYHDVIEPLPKKRNSK